MKKTILISLALFAATIVNAQSRTKTENVILVTLDGMRWQEVFGGAEERLMNNKKFVHDTAMLAKMVWAATPEERREKLMPFVWSVIGKQGQLYGNRDAGSKVNVTNTMWFSYPGYNEILTGAADDAHITSNDPNDNPNKTVLEFINSQQKFKGKVAAFTAWENFPAIINTKRSGIPVSSGLLKAEGNPTAEEKLLNELMFQLPNLTGGTRLDGLTFHYATEYLKKNNPRVLYLSFDETDHFAHEGEYDHYLASANYTDGFLRTLWTWLQSQPSYKDKTTLIVTTDHGRGHIADTDWRHHGSKAADSDQIWLAVLGPDSPALGEVKTPTQLYQNQVASTLAALLGLTYTNTPKPGDPVATAFKK